MGRGAVRILDNPNLKILNLAKLFVADAPMKKKICKFSFTPFVPTLKYGSENSQWVRGLIEFDKLYVAG